MSNLISRLQIIINEQAGGKHTVFAKNAGIPPSTFQAYVDGRQPKLEHLLRIREYYHVNIDWLVSGHGPHYLIDTETIAPTQSQALDADPMIADLLEGARRVLTSGNPIAYDALERNIRYFSHAIEVEKRLMDMESRLEKIEARGEFAKRCQNEENMVRKAG